MATIEKAPVPHEPALPEPGDEPVFAAPWQAEAFALVVSLHQRGAFSWDDWVRTLSDEIASDPATPDEDANDAYYRQWLAALEAIVARKNLSSPAEMRRRKEEWRAAYLSTPHGQPVELGRAQAGAGRAAHDHRAPEHDHDDERRSAAPRPVASSPARAT